MHRTWFPPRCGQEDPKIPALLHLIKSKASHRGSRGAQSPCCLSLLIFFSAPALYPLKWCAPLFFLMKDMSSSGLHMFEYLAWQWSGSTGSTRCKTPYRVNQTSFCSEIYSNVFYCCYTSTNHGRERAFWLGRMTSRTHTHTHTLATVQKTQRGLCQKHIA